MQFAFYIDEHLINKQSINEQREWHVMVQIDSWPNMSHCSNVRYRKTNGTVMTSGKLGKKAFPLRTPCNCFCIRLLFILVLVSISTCSSQTFALQTPGSPLPISNSQEEESAAEAEAAAANTTPDSVSVNDFASDDEIVSRLKRVYEASGWFTDLEVSCESGFVRLKGTTAKASNRDWAKQIAIRTEDVVGVDNKIDVVGEIDFSQAIAVLQGSLGELWQGFLLNLPSIVIAACIILLTFIVSKINGVVLRRFLRSQRRIRRGLQDLLIQLSSIAIWIIGSMLAMVVVFPGVTPAKALTVLGLGSIAIGFAFKDIFENFFAGILILWRYPFDRGDFIECGDIMGKVEEINVRNTLIRRTDGELVVVPNAKLFSSSVDVLTHRPKRRVRIICGVAYGEDVDQSREVICNAVESCESVDEHKDVQVFANAFGSSSIDFEVAWWTGATPLDVRRSRDEVIAAIKRALDDAGIEIPFPYRTLTFKTPLALAGGNGEYLTNATSSDRIEEGDSQD